MNTRLIPICCLPFAAGTVLLLGSCKDRQSNPSAGWEDELHRLELTQQIALAQYRLQQAPADDRQRLNEIHRDLASLARQSTALRQLHATLLTDIAGLEDRDHMAVQDLTSDALESQLRNRANEIGRHHPTLTLGAGRVFRDAVVTAITDAGVTVRHPDGVSRLDYFELTPAQRDQFGLDEVSATAALHLERQHAIAYDRWIERGMVAVREQQLAAQATAKAEAEAERASHQLAAAYAAAQPRVSLLSSSGRLQGASLHSRGPSWNDYRSRRSVYYYPYYDCPQPVSSRSCSYRQPSYAVGRSVSTGPARTPPSSSTRARTTVPAVAPRQGRTPSASQTIPSRR